MNLVLNSSSESIRLADFNKEEDIIKNELGGLFKVKVECFKEGCSNNKKKRLV